MQVHPVIPNKPYGNTNTTLNDILTPEQKNTVQQGVDDKIAEQVDKVKSNYQTAKDIDLMQSYYQQQQKLFDIYLQTSTGSNTESQSQNISAVSSLTDTYAELYQLHQSVKEGVVQLPSFELPKDEVETMPVNSTNPMMQSPSNSISSINQSLSNKQLDAYNSLMMPSTASYVHLSA
jgi:hypothetical protein